MGNKEKGNVRKMGMAASQVRFLSLQNRKNTIGLNLMTLSNRKTALSRDMSRVANEYNNAMNQKTLKWSNDSGVTYSDLTYDKLMKPNELNTTLPYIITDAQGRVVLDDSVIPLEDGNESKVTYRDLAMMISSYSGHNENGEATYNNLGNLVGGSGLSSATINGITDKNSIQDKATSGFANTDNEYKIVTGSQNMVTNSLRYEIMSKLELITPEEKAEIVNTEMKLYGSANNEDGPYPVGTLMGDYYLAKANYEAYRNLLQAGKFNFALTNDAQNFTETNAAIDGSGDISYTNTTGGVNGVSYNGASTYLNNVDLTKQYKNDQVTELTTAINGSFGNFSYEIKDGKITYSNTVQNLLALASSSNLDHDRLSNYGYQVTDDVSAYSYWTKDARWQRDISGNPNDAGQPAQTWKTLYDSNAVLFLTENNGGTNVFASIVKKNLEAYINYFGDDFAKGIESAGLEVDQKAINSAKISTIALFWGDILGAGTNSKKSNNEQIGWRNAPTSKDDDYNGLGTMNSAATDAALDHNLFGWATSDSGKDHSKSFLSVKNMVNTFVSFYDFYAQSERDPITKYDDVKNFVTTADAKETYNSDDTELKQIENTTINIGGTDYIVKTLQDTTDGTCQREYYLKDPNSGAEGDLVQIDLYNDGTTSNSEKFFQRTIYSNGNPTNYYQATDVANISTIITDTKATYGQSSLESFTPATSGGGSSATGSYVGKYVNPNNSMTLKFDSAFSTQKEITISQSKADSTYSSYLSLAFSEDKLNELQNKVNEAASAKDDALKELDMLFAEKDAKIMDYFDSLFKMISQNGWVYDENVNNQDKKEESKIYLNAKLQNNMYFITEVDTLDGKDFNYATKLATNVSKVFQVYDTDAQNTALSKYESEKADINAKEKQIDIRMNKLETEQDAIKTELDSIKSIIKDNVDSTFKIFT